ncbi:MAG: CdaR family protein [Acidaminococcaceae bacterium]|jgi:YbbR domain-containing protein|nr:CdaR family protein [Acidaminococcaceae bacterium]
MKEQEKRNKWVVRIFAFLTACALWLYVMNEQNPIIERTFTVPLAKINLAENMIVNNMPEKVSVRLKGPRTTISSAREKDISAYVDFSDTAKGRHNFDIRVKSNYGEVTGMNPEAVILDIDKLGEREMEAEARIIGVPGSGVTIGKLELEPARVTVKGASNRLAAVFKLIVLVDVTGRDKNFEQQANVVPIAMDGSEMHDLSVQPDKVQIKALMMKQLASVELPVKPVISGVLRNNYTISSIKTLPEKVRLTAEPAVLANLTEIKTAPVILDNIDGNTELQVPLNLPEKVLAETHSVMVKIEIEK